MRALVIYESMFGNTHEVAERIGVGLRSDPVVDDVEVISVGEAIGRIVSDVDLVVVGGPTHAHGVSRPTTRRAASDQAEKDPDLELEPRADGPGLREWFNGLPRREHGCAAAFDTRVDGPELVTGRASKGIARRLGKHGFVVVDDPESFLVDRQNRLLAGEADRAEEWAQTLAALALKPVL
jgi:Flavodoxin